jgi:DNA end-binding protein Ku
MHDDAAWIRLVGVLHKLPARTQPVQDFIEVAARRQHVGEAAGRFEPKKYHDTYREQVLEFIQQKAEGESPKPLSKSAPAARTVNLMEALRKSLAEAEKAEAANVDRHDTTKKRGHRAHAARRRATPKTSTRRTSRKK